MQNRRVYGIICEIHESETTLDATTPYRLQVLAQLVYYKQGHEDSWIWARTNAFSSNALLAGPESFQLGKPVFGILAPTYGTHLATQLESWHGASFEDWRLGGQGGIPLPHHFDLDPMTLDWLPVLGGSGFDLERLRWSIPGVRLRPPGKDVLHFHRDLAQKSKEKKNSKNVADPVPQHEIRKEAKKIYDQAHAEVPRGESAMANNRRKNSRRPKIPSPRSPTPDRGRPATRYSVATFGATLGADASAMVRDWSEIWKIPHSAFTSEKRTQNFRLGPVALRNEKQEQQKRGGMGPSQEPEIVRPDAQDRSVPPYKLRTREGFRVVSFHLQMGGSLPKSEGRKTMKGEKENEWGHRSHNGPTFSR